MMHQMNQRSGEHALILDALRNAYAEFHDPNGIALSRNRVLRSRPDRGSTPITRNKVCIKPSFTVNRFVGSPTPPRPGPGGLPPAATRSGVSCTTYSTQKLVRMERSPSSSAAGRWCHCTPSDYGRDLNDDLV